MNEQDKSDICDKINITNIETFNGKEVKYFSYTGNYIKAYSSYKDIRMIINPDHCRVYDWTFGNLISYNRSELNSDGGLLYDNNYEIKGESIERLISKLEIVLRMYKPNLDYANEVYWHTKHYFAVKRICKNMRDHTIFPLLNILKECNELKSLVNTGYENSMFVDEIVRLINNTQDEVHCDDLVYERLYSFNNIGIIESCISELKEIQMLLE